MKIDKNTILKFDRPGPRYTSYPTAPEWSKQINAQTYQEKLKQFGKTNKTLSLYVHIPFCESLCYFCGCTMNVRKNENRYGDEYIDHLETEIDLIAHHIKRKPIVRQLHWGGGTPSFFSEEQMTRLFKKIAKNFTIDTTGEIAIEVDPRRVTKHKVETLRKLGFNRISIGLQDFDEIVQKHVNRIQPFSMVREFNNWCREVKFASINFDLIYGMPYQTQKSFAATVKDVISLHPDRIALYSFAYVPWLKKHQNKLHENKLPSTDEKLEIFLDSRDAFLQNGYDAIAMDHFALKDDELSKAFQQGTLHRNFMGYTVKPADEYIGLGNSAIGYLEKAFFQNYKTIPEYYRFLKQNEFPVERGKELSKDDDMRQWVIKSLLCQFVIDKKNFTKHFSEDFDKYFHHEQNHIQKCNTDDLIQVHDDKIIVTDLGKIFIRNICMGFDWYLRQQNSHQKFSKTV
ncbi:MAG: oxygen-independent coproporphyrinogen III oxidase [Candidatus Omnitrophica bacterium]|nr:oxygen-independent coproporphyrinogen III oxidase [Candidatus Omnitrophota bacterium]